ncbi:Adaptor for signal transduction [Dinochytrium kinnereticum]|nr:Adaptor for signal transduction [Dinochytrium kinnereticum]
MEEAFEVLSSLLTWEQNDEWALPSNVTADTLSSLKDLLTACKVQVALLASSSLQISGIFVGRCMRKGPEKDLESQKEKGTLRITELKAAEGFLETRVRHLEHILNGLRELKGEPRIQKPSSVKMPKCKDKGPSEATELKRLIETRQSWDKFVVPSSTAGASRIPAGHVPAEITPVNTMSVASWSAYEVGSWLKSIGLAAYEGAFIENDISGDILVHADHGMLKELGVTSVGVRLQLLRSLSRILSDDGVAVADENCNPATARPTGSRNRGTEEQIEGMMREITRLNMELMQLRSELSPVWVLVKEYKHFQQISEQRKNASPQIQTSKVANKASKSSVKSPNKSASAFSPEVAEFTSPKTPSGSQARTTDSNVGTIKIYLDKILNGSSESYKSFRVSSNDSCSKILPAVLKKYKISEHWQNFGLFVCLHRSERCLSFDEKPLELISMLKDGEDPPVFSLKHTRSLYYNRPIPRRSFDSERSMAASSYRSRISPDSQGYTSPTDHYYAVYDYKAQEDYEVDLSIGDKVQILARESGWANVRRDSPNSNQVATGWVPVDCIGNSDESQEGTYMEGRGLLKGQGLVLYDYMPGSPGEIAVRKGEVVNLRRRIDHWFAVEYGDKKGWMAASFISPI